MTPLGAVPIDCRRGRRPTSKMLRGLSKIARGEGPPPWPTLAALRRWGLIKSANGWELSAAGKEKQRR